jgi:hypothetical protein
MNRKYFPTFAELVDRLSIVILKTIFIPENKDAYEKEQELIMHDIDVLLTERSHAEGGNGSHLCKNDTSNFDHHAY